MKTSRSSCEIPSRTASGLGSRILDTELGPQPISQAEAFMLALAKMIEPRIVVEVGVLCAETTVYLAWHLPNATIYGLDLDIERPQTLIKAWGLPERITLIQGPSASTIASLPDNIDFVYIDGEHAYPFVKADTEAIWPKVSAGGLMVFHDVNGPGVAEYVPERFPHAIYLPFSQGTAVVQKRPKAIQRLDGTLRAWPQD